MLTSFPTKKTYNTGGYRGFYFVPSEKVLTYPMISNGAVVVPVGLYADAAWLKGYATPETFSYVEEHQLDSNGSFYNLTVAGFVPGDKAELIGLMSELALYRYVLLITDITGYVRLVGSPAAPLDFTATFNSGLARTDTKGFNFQFTGQCLHRAPVHPVV